jgi:alpha,alpha-trehalose phosphorylase
LLLHYPYFDLYRKQVVKQADLVLAMHRRTDAFTPEQKARNFAYYEQLTVRDSSLSACTQAVIAAEVGHTALAYDYLGEAALMDLDDLEHNTRDGLHMAALAGSWIALIAGLAGMRDQNGALAFAPRLPDTLTRLAFTITRQTRCLAVEITPSAATYTMRSGEPLHLAHHAQPITVTVGKPITRPIPALSMTGPQPTQPPGRTPSSRSRRS